MSTLNQTLKDLVTSSRKGKFEYLITRYNPKQKDVSDLDILINKKDFRNAINQLRILGYETSSHDNALGGRIKGSQINLTKNDRIKIDLHKDFTWRAKRYIDLDLVWSNKDLVDEFLVFINVIFEKTYIDQDDYEYIWSKKDKVFARQEFRDQAKKHDWLRTFEAFKSWNPDVNKFPLFISPLVILISYREKFHLISFLYFIFFRVRYLIWDILPYD